MVRVAGRLSDMGTLIFVVVCPFPVRIVNSVVSFDGSVLLGAKNYVHAAL